MLNLATPLLTDLYQFNMLQAYLDQGETELATFEFFVRRLPRQRSFLMAAGLEQAIGFLETVQFSTEDLDWLAQSRRFKPNLLRFLQDFRFSGDVWAMREGSVFFGEEPILRVTAPLPQAQFVETRLINILQFQSLIASKAARMVLLAPQRRLVDFGLRRAHGAEAGLMAARASYIAGFDSTATVLANAAFGIPISGTMAHSFVQTFDDEAAAFEAFARARPDDLVLLIDTYDVAAAARKVVALAPRLKAIGAQLRAVRIDSGDLISLSRITRQILDDGGLNDVAIFVSGGLDEADLAAFAKEDAPIDGAGVGSSLATSADAPTLDCVYKLQEYAGLPRRKRSHGKSTWPGRKQVWRRFGRDGRMAGDLLSLEGAVHPGTPLLQCVMRDGRRTQRLPTLHEIRGFAARELSLLPEPLRRLEAQADFRVEIADELTRLADDVDRRLAQQETPKLRGSS